MGKCPYCNGTGKAIVKVPGTGYEPGNVKPLEVKQTCSSCGGSGKKSP
ncbi:hypothetical protein RJG79_08320 [Mycoplasmatota bacterium WC44]